MKKDILLVDKPVGWTSFDVVAKIRNTLRAVQASNNKQQKTNNSQSSNINDQKPKKIKVGHAGTLDPFATGLLIILVGDECKKAGDFLKLDKTYEFTAKLGEVSTTGDPEGEILEYEKWNMKNGPSSGPLVPTEMGIQPHSRGRSDSTSTPTSAEVKKVFTHFTGEITQIPPAYSAIKVDGKRAYKLAREGKKVEIPPRQVKINRIELVSYTYPYLRCVCDVSSGTYIRTLVEDIGTELGVGAYCTELRRTKIGQYDITHAKTVKQATSLSE